jgi:predicted site-specific integrase-resolvase
MDFNEYLEMLQSNYGKMILSKKEVIKVLGVSQATVDRLRKAGKLKTKKVLEREMFTIDEIARFLSELK